MWFFYAYVIVAAQATTREEARITDQHGSVITTVVFRPAAPGGAGIVVDHHGCCGL